MSRRSNLGWFLAGAGLLSCAPKAVPTLPGDCSTDRVTRSPTHENAHVRTCGDPACGNGLNPPTGGPHCAELLSCRSYDTEQERCTWIHNLEHGHAVFAYNCPGGCAATVEALARLREGVDAGKNAVVRALLVPDSKLPDKVAVVLWGWSYVGDEVDEEAIGCLLAHQDEGAPEAGLACPP